MTADTQYELSQKPPWWKRGDVRKVGVIWLVLTVGLGLIAGEIIARSMGAPASDLMEQDIRLMRIFTWASAPVAGFVGAICITMLMSKLHYGTTPPEESDHQIEKAPRATALWIVASSLLCLFALVFGLVVMQNDARMGPEGEMIKVNVTGNQWIWNFDYPDNGVRSNELYLPLNQTVEFSVTSKDVKHSFWIVQMGVKIDANPGYKTEISVTPNRLGIFDVRCAELCGLLHAYMQNQVHVVTRADYDKWISSQGGHL